MILGQSAATTASLALRQNIAVQDVDYEQLREVLLEDGQVLEYAGETLGKGAIDPSNFKEGTIVDDIAATKTGSWSFSTSAGAYIGREYLHDGNAADGRSSVRYEAKLATGSYEIRLAYSPHSNRATNAPVTIQHASGSATILVNQKQKPTIDNLFFSLGKFEFKSDTPAVVTISNQGTDGHVIADAVYFVPVK